MGRSLHIGTYAGIPVYVHWTFGLLVLGLVYFGVHLGFDTQASIWFSAYIFTLFFCVILHEYGHSFMARRFGVETRDIILSPIGGLARLESIPTIPKQELLIAFAGPFVNVGIALILGTIMYLIDMPWWPSKPEFPVNFTEYLQLVFTLNIILVVFNLIPAFPMDGGRVFRALLAMKFEYTRATFIASITGRILAIGFVLAGIYYYSPLWLIIGVFIFFMAKKEYEHVRRSSKLKSTKISSISNYGFSILYDDELMQRAVDQNQITEERSFLIKNRMENLVGSLPEVVIQYALKNNKLQSPIQSFMSKKLQEVNESISVFEAFNLMDKNDLGLLIVKNEEGISAVLDRSAVKGFLRSL